MTFRQRSMVEAMRASQEALTYYRTAQAAEIDQESKKDALQKATKGFLTALVADPYNPHATYYLAALYAEIGANQCAMNLLARLSRLHGLASLREEVEQRIDRLIGRHGPLDPSFSDLRLVAEARPVFVALANGGVAETPTVPPHQPALDVEHPGPLPTVPAFDDAPAPKPKAPKAPPPPETVPVTAKILEVRGSGTGTVMTLGAGSSAKLTVGMRGFVGGTKGVATITAVRAKECDATSALSLDAMKSATGVVFQVPKPEDD